MSTAADLRFLFDNDFHAPKADPSAQTEPVFEPNVDEERIAREKAQAEVSAQAASEADAAGYERGKAEALQAASEREDARLNRLMERLDQQFGALAADVQARVAQVEMAAAEMGVEAARRLAPALVASQPETEIAAFFMQALKDFIDAPKLDIRLNPADAVLAGGLLKKLAASGGYEGAIRVRPDEALEAGDCIIGWGDGGARREIGAVDDELAAMVADYFRTDDGAATQTTEETDT